MNYCTKCGSKLEEGETTCHNCGYNFASKQYENLKDEEVEDEEVEDEELDEEPGLPKLSKRKKIGILSAVIAIIVVVCFIFMGRSLAGPSKIADRFQADIASGNKSDLSKILYSNDNRLKIDESGSSTLISYFKDNPSYLNKVVDNMNTQISNTNLIKKASAASKNNFSLVIAGRTMLFFPKYKVNVRPTFIQINTGIKNVELSLDGNKIGKSDTDNFTKEFGPFMPGKYKLYANYKGNYTSLNKAYDIDLVDSENDRVNVDVFKDLKYIQINGQYPNAEIFVNNKNSKVRISDAGNFGPVNPGTKIYAIADEGGKKLKSDEYMVTSGDSDVELNFSDAEENLSNVQSQIGNLMSMYTTSFCQAINSGDFSNTAPYLYPGSNLYNAQVKYVSDTYNKGVNEEIVSCSVISYNLSDDNKSGTVTTAEVYRIISKDGDSSIKSFKYTYGFKYNDDMGMYQLTSIS
ncbi:zinc ribbon domain-containing protein [Clostridium tyrobutyricum]|uniref:zinc ribbon domain-containing protein n=1 Tax=Clostridium tyrobutyricum TaxID=1519 RepID=UPI00073D3962|nr:membrane-associated protein [Clostridium tyrobutyricum]QCH26588.1 Membrane-associated protein TcaA [Clostridium tyrobutyricum]